MLCVWDVRTKTAHAITMFIIGAGGAAYVQVWLQFLFCFVCSQIMGICIDVSTILRLLGYEIVLVEIAQTASVQRFTTGF